MTIITQTTDVFLEQEAADYLKLQPPTLRRWRWAGRELPYVKCGGRVRYLKSDLDAWLENNRRASTSQKNGGRND
jgi:excisionase family DNA binding protein